MARVPFWRAPALAFHSERPYISAARDWRGLALGYLLVLATAVWLPSATSLQQDLAWIRGTFVPAVVDDMPPVEIRDGQAFVTADTPFELTGPDGSVVAILAPGADRSALDGLDGGLLLTRDTLYLETFQGVRAMDLATIPDTVITAEAFEAAAATTTRWFGWLAYPVGTLLGFLYRLGQVLVYALATVVLARTVGTSLTYAAAVRVTAVAVTPTLALALLQSAFGFTIPAWWIVAVATTFIYAYFGVRGLADAGSEHGEDSGAVA